MFIIGAGATAGAASLSPPPNSVVNHTPPAVTTVPATPTIVFLRPDQVPSFVFSTYSDIKLCFCIYSLLKSVIPNKLLFLS